MTPTEQNSTKEHSSKSETIAELGITLGFSVHQLRVQ